MHIRGLYIGSDGTAWIGWRQLQAPFLSLFHLFRVVYFGAYMHLSGREKISY